MSALFFLFVCGGCSLPDRSLFQKGSGNLYEGGTSASDLDSEDTGLIEDTSVDTALEETGIEETGFSDSATEDTAAEEPEIEDSGTEEAETEDTGADTGSEQ